jgi:ERF superfamily
MKSGNSESPKQKQTPTDTGESIESRVQAVESNGILPREKAVPSNSKRDPEPIPANGSEANQFELHPDDDVKAAANVSALNDERAGGEWAETSGKLGSFREDINLRQKLAEVRRRIGYIQKRGLNERFNYTYVTAADMAGAVGDALADLGVVVIPSLESISHETVTPNQAFPQNVTRVVMSYTFMDIDSSEQLTVKIPGEGRDPGDKGPYKAMTGALKYALLQSFLIATGDDPEDERAETGDRPVDTTGGATGLLISAEQVARLQEMIDQTGTEVGKVLEYFKVAKLEELTTDAYLRAIKVLKRKPPLSAVAVNAHA